VTSAYKILVVDDDPAVRQTFAQTLTRKGHTVVGAETGLEALDKAAHDDFDAVFLDIMMPGMDGIEVAEQLQETHPSLPVVIVTGYGSAEHRARAAAAGVRGFLCKPLSPEVIESGLDAAVSGVAQPLGESLRQGAAAAVRRPVGAAATPAHSLPDNQPATPRTAGQVAKDIALFFAGPLITMADLSLFPFIALRMLRQARHHRTAAD
jgi:CheY-like chemotaxis protein